MYAIVGAMQEEVAAIKQKMRNIQSKTIGPVEFTSGELGGQSVLLYHSGVGLSMAAMSTGIACSNFDLKGILNVGTAGGLHPDLKVLDQVISTKITYHEMDITPFGNPRDFSDHNRYVFNSDETFIQVARQLIDQNVMIGPMVSGNQFIYAQSQVDAIQAHYPEAICVEMEGAAIAHVASQFKVPFIVLRSISDHVLAPSNEMSFETYLHLASERSALLCERFLERV